MPIAILKGKFRSKVIILQIQTSHYQVYSLQNYHTLALFEPSTMSNSMSLVFCHIIKTNVCCLKTSRNQKRSSNKAVTTNIILFLKHFESTTMVIMQHVSPWHLPFNKTPSLHHIHRPKYRRLEFMSGHSFRSRAFLMGNLKAWKEINNSPHREKTVWREGQGGWLVGCLVAWLVGWLVAWLVGWLVVCRWMFGFCFSRKMGSLKTRWFLTHLYRENSHQDDITCLGSGIPT